MNRSRGGVYEFCVGESLDPSWSEWFDGFSVSVSESRGTRLVGFVRDQAALHGLLARIRNLNLTLILVVRIADGEGPAGMPFDTPA